jgi:mRNA-degrading endonuclease RelE of RelBE toxin-antitoxin system
MATVLLTASARKEYDALPLTIQARVAGIFARLKNWPEVNAKPLHAPLAGHFRIRTGDYRVQFYVTGDTVMVEKVGHRDGFYGD